VASSSAEQVVAVVVASIAAATAAVGRSYPWAFAATATIVATNAADYSLLSFDRCCTPDCTACCYACCNVGYHRDLDSFLSKSFRDHLADRHVLGARISSHRACSGFHHFDSCPECVP